MTPIQIQIIKASEAYQEAMINLIAPIQSMQPVKLKAVDALANSAQELCLSLKDQELIPKLVLKDLYLAPKMLRNEANYRKPEEKTLLLELATKLEQTFSYILSNTSHLERIPGVPRAF